jgi:hypothetical protein
MERGVSRPSEGENLHKQKILQQEGTLQMTKGILVKFIRLQTSDIPELFIHLLLREQIKNEQQPNNSSTE